MTNIGVDVVIGFPIPQAYFNNTVQPGYAWAVTFAPSVSAFQAINKTVNSVTANAQAATNVPSLETSSSSGKTVNAVAGSAQADTLVPSVSTTKSVNATPPTAAAQAVASDASISTGSVVNSSVTSVTASVTAVTLVPALSTSGGATSYLILDGVDDYLKLPSAIAFDEVIMDFKARQETGKYYIDARTGVGSSYLWSNGTTSTAVEVTGSSSAWLNGMYWNDVLGSNNTNFIPNDTRGTLRLVLSASGTDNVNFFSINSNGSNMAADVFSIKVLLGGVVKVHWDMSTGTAQDQSGNGNHAILFGGTWGSL